MIVIQRLLIFLLLPFTTFFPYSNELLSSYYVHLIPDTVSAFLIHLFFIQTRPSYYIFNYLTSKVSWIFYFYFFSWSLKIRLKAGENNTIKVKCALVWKKETQWIQIIGIEKPLLLDPWFWSKAKSHSWKCVWWA